MGYVREMGNDEPRPQLYLHPYGQGEVLYLTLGHCRGKYDMQPIMPVCSVSAARGTRRCELLRRGIRWGIGQLGD